MKRVRALTAAPPKMAAYVGALNGVVATDAAAATDVWRRFRKSRREPYPELVQALAAAQGGLCAYCERRLTSADGQLVRDGYEADHVLPKSRFPAQTLEASNLVLSCKLVGAATGSSQPSGGSGFAKTCGSEKGATELDARLEPRALPLQPTVFVVGLNGRMEPDNEACLSAGVTRIDAERVLQTLNLNAEALRKRRQDTADQLRQLIVASQSALEGLAPEPKRLALRSVLERIAANRLAPDAMNQLVAFWSTERAVLGAAAEQYLAENPVY